MKTKGLLIAGAILLILFLFSVNSFAAPKGGPGKAHADRNKDGTVDQKEKQMKIQRQLRGKAKVNTEVEAKYDANGDGWIEPAERKVLLKDKAEIIKTEGKAKVNTAVEKEYDTNQDGIIDAKEAEAWKDETQD